jgi:hypothetical protein
MPSAPTGLTNCGSAQAVPVAPELVGPVRQRDEVVAVQRADLARARGVEVVVIALDAGGGRPGAAGAELQIVAGRGPETVVQEGDVRQRVEDVEPVALRLVDRVVRDLQGPAERLDEDRLVGALVDQVVGDGPLLRPDAGRVGVDLVAGGGAARDEQHARVAVVEDAVPAGGAGAHGLDAVGGVVDDVARGCRARVHLDAGPAHVVDGVPGEHDPPPGGDDGERRVVVVDRVARGRDGDVEAPGQPDSTAGEVVGGGGVAVALELDVVRGPGEGVVGHGDVGGRDLNPGALPLDRGEGVAGDGRVVVGGVEENAVGVVVDDRAVADGQARARGPGGGVDAREAAGDPQMIERDVGGPLHLEDVAAAVGVAAVEHGLAA